MQKYKPLTDLMKTNRELTEACARSINLPADYKWQNDTPLQDGMMVRHNRCEDGFDLPDQTFAPLTCIANAMTVAAYHRMKLEYGNESAKANGVEQPYIRYETHFMNLAMCRAITIAATGRICSHQ